MEGLKWVWEIVLRRSWIYLKGEGIRGYRYFVNVWISVWVVLCALWDTWIYGSFFFLELFLRRGKGWLFFEWCRVRVWGLLVGCEFLDLVGFGVAWVERESACCYCYSFRRVSLWRSMEVMLGVIWILVFGLFLIRFLGVGDFEVRK